MSLTISNTSPRKLAAALLGIGDDREEVKRLRTTGRAWLREVMRGNVRCTKVKRTAITAAQAYAPPWDEVDVYDRNVRVYGMDKDGDRYLLQFKKVERWVDADYTLYAEQEVE